MRVEASISNDTLLASPAVSSGRCAAPGPAPVWHDAQFSARIGATSAANATVRTPSVVAGASEVVLAAVVAGEPVLEVAGVVGSVAAVDADVGAAVDSSDGCDEQAATTIASPMTACRINRTGLEMLDIGPVWRCQALIATWAGMRARSASVPATPHSDAVNGMSQTALSERSITIPPTVLASPMQPWKTMTDNPK
jgi:hypothetical protein